MPGRPTSPSPGGEGPREPFHVVDYVALFLELVLGASAFAAGALLILAPDGSGVSLPPGHRGPFSSFLVPGLLLFSIVGGTLAAAGISTLSRRALAPVLTVAAGVVLLVWIVVQIAMIGLISFLQMFVFASGLFLAAGNLLRALRATRTLRHA